MKNYISLLTFLFTSLFCNVCISNDINYSIKDVQGGWWASCNDPAVEFYIKGGYYFGDFLGKYKVKVIENNIIFKSGLIDGHSINVTGKPLSFRIIKLDKKVLYLKPSVGNHDGNIWKLNSCVESDA